MAEQDDCAIRQMVIARDFRIRRSELTIPGNSLKMMAKAGASDADQVIFDLEDTLAVSQKEAGRQTVIEALHTLEFGGKTTNARFEVNTTKCRDDFRTRTAGTSRSITLAPSPADSTPLADECGAPLFGG